MSDLKQTMRKIEKVRVRRGTDEQGKPYVSFEFASRSGATSIRPLSLADLNVDPAALYRAAGEAGISLGSARAKARLRQLADTLPKESAFTVATKVGWNRHGTYVSPSRIYGESRRNVIPALDKILRPGRWTPRGSLSRWKRALRRAGKRNPYVIFASCVPFLPPLLQLLDLEGVGFMTVGSSSTGKSKVTHLAASVWGGDRESKRGFLDTWGVTHSGLEPLSLQARDGFLAIDETKLANTGRGQQASLLADAVFRLVSGSEKVTFSGSRSETDWRLVYWTSSNQTLREILESGGAEYDESYAVRLIELPVFGTSGVFHHIPDGMAPADFADKIEQDSRSNYGAAIDAFLRDLVARRRENKSALVEWLRARMATMNTALAITGDHGSVARVAKYFAATYAAARLAQEIGILPWSTRDIRRSIVACYKAHRRHVASQASTSDPLDELNGYIGANLPQALDVRKGYALAKDGEIVRAPLILLPSKSRDVEVDFAMSSEAFEQAFGERARALLRALKRQGLLRHDQGKLTIKRQIRRGRRDRVYCISGRAHRGQAS